MNDRLHQACLTLPSAAQLFDNYQPGATLFASPRRTTLASGAGADGNALLSTQSGAGLPHEATRLLARLRRDGARAPLLMGAVPFDADQPAHLFAPADVISAPGNLIPAPGASASDPALPFYVTPAPSPQAYRANVVAALAAIARGDIEKVVLARSITMDAAIDVPALLRTLGSRNSAGYTFAVDLPDRGTLVGASPELLLARRGMHVSSHPLAGSIPRSADPVEDRCRAAGLLVSAKDLHEHALVVDAVAAALRPWCAELAVPALPSLVATPTMWHLGSEVRGVLADPSASSLTLAMALHPTPAVCGHPTLAARHFLAAHEEFDRDFYAGLVGWCDADGDGEWAVTLRCARIEANSATLYAGAGIVAGSDPDLELRETSAKLRTMLAAMGLEAVLEGTQ